MCDHESTNVRKHEIFPERRAGINPEAFLMADAGLLAMARRYHAAADYARVEQSCRQVLADDPHQAEAWRLLAEACLLQGRSGEAAEAHHNLGVALARLGRPDEAVQSYREAVRLRPGYAEAHSNLGIALERGGAG